MVHAETTNSLMREGALYQLAHQEPAFESIKTQAPQYLDYNASQHILITRLIDGVMPLQDRFNKQGHIDAPTVARLAQSLAQVHLEAPKMAAVPQNKRAFLPGQLPWVFSNVQQSLQAFAANPQGMPQAQQQLLQQIQQMPDLLNALNGLAHFYTPLCLIHGDIKWDNILASEEKEPKQFFITDWELADIGDPIWDVACVMHSFATQWMFLLNTTPGQNGYNGPQWKAEHTFAVAQQFWQNYTEALGFSPQQEAMQRLRMMKFVGARLVQSTFEMLHNQPSLPPTVQSILQYARFALLSPDAALPQVLGMAAPNPQELQESQTALAQGANWGTLQSLNWGQPLPGQQANNAQALPPPAPPVVPAPASNDQPQNSKPEAKAAEAPPAPAFTKEVAQRLEQLFKALQVHTPLSFQYEQQPIVQVPNPVQPNPQNPQGQAQQQTPHQMEQATRQALINALNPVLYEQCYTQKFENPQQPVQPTPAQVLQEGPLNPQAAAQQNTNGVAPDHAFLQELSQANHTQAHWDKGWKVYQADPNGYMHVQKGDAYRMSIPGQYAFTQAMGRMPQNGDLLDVYLAKEGIGQMFGWYMVYSQMAASEFDDALLARIYFSIQGAHAPWLVSFLTQHLNNAGVPFSFKTLDRRQAYALGRGDSAVLYIGKRFLTPVLDLLNTHQQELAQRLHPHTPLFAKPLMPGLSMADDPRSGQSFGQSRMHLVAQGIVNAWYQGHSSVEKRMEATLQAFVQAGLDPAKPYLNNGNVDLFEWPHQPKTQPVI